MLLEKLKHERCKVCIYYKKSYSPKEDKYCCTEWGNRWFHTDFIYNKTKLLCFRRKKIGACQT